MGKSFDQKKKELLEDDDFVTEYEKLRPDFMKTLKKLKKKSKQTRSQKERQDENM